MPTSNARLGYVNLLSSGSVVASSADVDFPVANAYDWLTSDFFKPAAGGTTNIDLTLATAASADYFAFYNSDLAGLSGTIKLQWWNGTAYVDCFSAISPGDNAPKMVAFGAQTSTKWRVVISCASVFSIACIAFGPQLSLEYGMYLGWTPPPFGRKTQTVTSVADGGNFLGRSVVAKGVSSTIELQYASDTWMRSNWLAFVRHAEQKPFFFVPDIVKHPEDAVFCWVPDGGSIPAPQQTQYGHMGASIPIQGLVE